MLKAVEGPGGRRVKFGRKPPPIAAGPRLSLGNYLLKKFPPPPPAIDYTQAAIAALRDPLGNLGSGNCAVAAAFHIESVILANSGKSIPFLSEDVTGLYKLLSGWNGIPDDPSDTGLDVRQVLNYWQAKGLPPNADTITGWISIDESDLIEVMAAEYLFENLYFGIGLPQAWVDAMPDLKDGFVWDVAGPAIPENGHAFIGSGYAQRGVKIGSTWGIGGLITWDAVRKYASPIEGGELYCVLDPDIIDKASSLSPAGFNWTALVSDFQSIGA